MDNEIWVELMPGFILALSKRLSRISRLRSFAPSACRVARAVAAAQRSQNSC